MTKQKQDTADPVTVPVSKLALALGMSQNRVHQLIESKVIPKALGRGEYDIVVSVSAYIQYLQSGRKSSGISQQRERLLAAQAARSEHALKVDTESYVDKKEVEWWLADLLVTCRSHMAQLPSVLMRELGDSNAEKVRVKELAEQRVREVLDKIGSCNVDIQNGKKSLEDDPDLLTPDRGDR